MRLISTCILGLTLNHETKLYTLDNELSKHGELRLPRANLIVSSNILYYFEVFDFKNKSRQIHCLLEDSSIVIFNKRTKKIITYILADTKLLTKYINKIPIECIEEKEIEKLNKCSSLNKVYQVNQVDLKEKDLEKYIYKKKQILNT